MALPPPPVVDDPAPDTAAPTAAPLYQSLLAWSLEHLAAQGFSRPLGKRLAVLLAGLLAGERATLSHLASSVQRLALSPAQEPSILRRFTRLLDDPRLDPARLLPALVPALLARALAPLEAAHAADPPGAGARTPWIRLVVDETTIAGCLHVLLVGLAVPGLVLPLALRCWRQNVALPPGAYWTELTGACWQVQQFLPPAVRAHVLLLADRAYGVPRFLDLCQTLGWAYAVRAQGQIHVRLQRQQAARPLRALVPQPGPSWYGGWSLETVTRASDPTANAAADEAAWVFQQAGWRRCQVVAAWADGQAEPWLVLTNLPGTPERLREYASRWAIERTFLSWKSHGWDLEATGLTDPARLARLVTGVALATWWRLACALPTLEDPLAALGVPARSRRTPRQLRLPWAGPVRLPRPWLAKFSLLTWGAKAARGVDLRRQTPALAWPLPLWPALTWRAYCAARAAPPAA